MVRWWWAWPKIVPTIYASPAIVVSVRDATAALAPLVVVEVAEAVGVPGTIMEVCVAPQDSTGKWLVTNLP